VVTDPTVVGAELAGNAGIEASVRVATAAVCSPLPAARFPTAPTPTSPTAIAGMTTMRGRRSMRFQTRCSLPGGGGAGAWAFNVYVLSTRSLGVGNQV
jgi:hypothetical protein